MRGMQTEAHRLLRAIFEEMQTVTQRAIAPWTRQGKLDLTSPHILGPLPPSKGGTGGTSVPIPPPYVYLTDADGAYLTDADGAYLYELL